MYMALYSDSQRITVEAVVGLAYCNPFQPERIAFERTILGKQHAGFETSWHKQLESGGEEPNVDAITEVVGGLVEHGRRRLAENPRAPDDELSLYEDMALYYIYQRIQGRYVEIIRDPPSASRVSKSLFADFADDMERYLSFPGIQFPSANEASHLFACFFQLKRAFHHVYENIIGGSPAAARLRVSIWESIFTHDMRRYRRSLHERMGDYATLVMGPSGTGKELVAQAIGYSRYVAFSPASGMFTDNYAVGYTPLNLSAFSPGLIESELFGHRKGSFTGATTDRVGWLERCPATGTVFLDEIGDLDPSIQVKILRVLQSRAFEPVGSGERKRFIGKIIAATNQDVAVRMADGTFRADLYYRLCSDVIRTPTLVEQVADDPSELDNLLRYLSQAAAGAAEAPALAAETRDWIRTHIPDGYPWPGNVRELEQCVRNVAIRKAYYPSQADRGAIDGFCERVRSASMTIDELVEHYCSLAYSRTGNYQETARRLGIDGRMVKAKVNETLVRAFGHQ